MKTWRFELFALGFFILMMGYTLYATAPCDWRAPDWLVAGRECQ